eukprot:GFUD01042166.1.p1 GENE.GFUD01042166.1~~GFUD01042166.1.p1  ORF type:complete len:345 (-),score=48.84 GFUD01042166.1:57-1049(-)
MARLVKFCKFLNTPQLSVTRVRCSSTLQKESLFFDSEVQSLMNRLAGLNYDKVFHLRKLGKDPERPIYQFMTEEELEEAKAEIKKKALKKLAMPPVMEERTTATQVLEKDELLAGFDTSKYVFTDISFGISERSRIIVVRETDGTLRTSNWDEQDRLNQTYFPREGRRHYVPTMFETDHLKEILEPSKYEYVLDRNCLQFEPDHPVYIRTCNTVFDHINEHRHFDSLHSTRHYGPMVFNFCWNKQLDELLAHLVWNDRLVEAVDAIKLYLKIHPDCKMNSTDLSSCLNEDLVRSFAKFESLKAGKIHMALEKLLESKQTTETILTGHGAK